MRANKTIRLQNPRDLRSNDLKAIQDHLKILYDELDAYMKLLYQDARFGGDVIEQGSAQGQILFWDGTNKKWIHTEVTEVFYDDTNKIFRVGDATNNAQIASNGAITLHGTAQTWEDLRIVPGAFQFAGAADPTIESWQPAGSGTTYKVYKFKKNDEVFFTCQLPHNYKEGSDIKPHLHWTPCDRGNEEDGKKVGWKIDYSWANTNAAFGASATIDLSDACSGTDDLHELTVSKTISGTAKTISSILSIKLYRSDTGTDDTWVGTSAAQSPAILEFDLHFEIDSLGSNLELTK